MNTFDECCQLQKVKKVVNSGAEKRSTELGEMGNLCFNTVPSLELIF